MDNEIIQIFFDPATENIDWEKRKPRNGQQFTKTPKQEYSIKQFVTQNKSSVHSEMTEDLSKFITEIKIRIDEYKNLGAKELLKQLDEDYRFLCVNFEHFGRTQTVASCIQRISSILEKEGVNIQKSNDNTQNGKTQRGIEIQEELASLREEIKIKDLNPIKKENLTNNLLKLKREITLEMEKFSKFDSIPIRLNQIENYLKKLKEQEEKKTKTIVSIQNKNQETINEKTLKKEKKRVIWRFGL